MTKPPEFRGASSLRAQLIVDALKRHGPITVRDLAVKIDLPSFTVSSTISDIRKSPGLIRIVEYWDNNTHIYEWSSEADAKKVKQPRQLGWTRRHRESLVPPRPQLPAKPLPPLAWLATQLLPQLSHR